MTALNRAVVVQTKTILSGINKRAILDDCRVSTDLNDVVTRELVLEQGEQLEFNVEKFMLIRCSDEVEMVIDIGQPMQIRFLCTMANLGKITIVNTHPYSINATILYA